MKLIMNINVSSAQTGFPGPYDETMRDNVAHTASLSSMNINVSSVITDGQGPMNGHY